MNRFLPRSLALLACVATRCLLASAARAAEPPSTATDQPASTHAPTEPTTADSAASSVPTDSPPESPTDSPAEPVPSPTVTVDEPRAVPSDAPRTVRVDASRAASSAFPRLPTESLQVTARGGPTVLLQNQAAAYVVPTLGLEGLRWFTPGFGAGGALDLGLHRQGTEEAAVLELRTHFRAGVDGRHMFRDAFGFRVGAAPGLLWSFRDVRAGGRSEGVHRLAPSMSVRASFETRVSDGTIVSIGALGSVEPQAIECFAFVSYAWMR